MDDRTLIAALGGPAKIAELLGLDKGRGGVQRVQNWRTRGIPPKVKLERPDLFLGDLTRRAAQGIDDQVGPPAEPSLPASFGATAGVPSPSGSEVSVS